MVFLLSPSFSLTLIPINIHFFGPYVLEASEPEAFFRVSDTAHKYSEAFWSHNRAALLLHQIYFAIR
jgi:hypothetical protein